MIAAAEVNPDSTGWLRKFASRPNRSAPSASRTSAARNASTSALAT